jgi:hypothetical protein
VSNIAGSSVETEQRTPAAVSSRNGWRFERRDGAGPDVRDRADVQHDLALAELLDERRILDRPDAVADPVGMERAERPADRFGACDLAGVRRGCEALGASQLERRRVRLRGEVRLEPAEPDGDAAAVPVPRRHPDELHRAFE